MKNLPEEEILVDDLCEDQTYPSGVYQPATGPSPVLIWPPNSPQLEGLEEVVGGDWSNERLKGEEAGETDIENVVKTGLG